MTRSPVENRIVESQSSVRNDGPFIVCTAACLFNAGGGDRHFVRHSALRRLRFSSESHRIRNADRLWIVSRRSVPVIVSQARNWFRALARPSPSRSSCGTGKRDGGEDGFEHTEGTKPADLQPGQLSPSFEVCAVLVHAHRCTLILAPPTHKLACRRNKPPTRRTLVSLSYHAGDSMRHVCSIVLDS